MDDSNSWSSGRLAGALGRLGDRRAIEPLVEFLGKRPDSTATMHALATLGAVEVTGHFVDLVEMRLKRHTNSATISFCNDAARAIGTILTTCAEAVESDVLARILTFPDFISYTAEQSRQDDEVTQDTSFVELKRLARELIARADQKTRRAAIVADLIGELERFLELRRVGRHHEAFEGVRAKVDEGDWDIHWSCPRDGTCQ